MVRYAGFVLILLTPFVARAEFTRAVHLELDPVDGATAYEIQIKNIKSGQVEKHKLKEPIWSGNLPLGSYEMTSRALDYRGVPGSWSDASQFDVGLEKVQLQFPTAGATVASKSDESESVTFKWKPVAGADAYEIEVTNADGSFKKSERVKDPSCQLDMPVAQRYSWKVTAYGPDDFKSEANSDFDIGAGALEKPKVEKPANTFVREVHWSAPAFAQTYDVAVLRRDPTSKKWQSVQTFNGIGKTQIDFDAKWPGGVYRVEVRAKADHRPDSQPGVVAFRAHEGDRSPAAEFASTLRDSTDRSNGWFAVAAYMVTDVQYSAYNYDTRSTLTAFSGVGGTGRLGGGYFKKNSEFGVVAITDLSGIDDKHGSFTYASAEASCVWKKRLGDRSEIRAIGGLYYKELPIAVVDPTTLTVTDFKNSAVVGPHLGGEYWYSLTPKFGLQANLNFYESVLDISTPNGQGIDPTMSTEFGISGSYRVNNRFTGLLGFTRRSDNIEYKSTTAGSSDSATVTGNYISLLAEYNF